MNNEPTHWAFNFEVLSRALQDLESTCKAPPESSEFDFLRSEAPAILAEAREALSSLMRQLQDCECAQSRPPPRPTAH